MNLVLIERAGFAPLGAACGVALAAALVVAGAAGTRPAAQTIALVGWAVAIVVAAVVDARAARLPDPVVVPGVLYILVAGAWAGRGVAVVAGAALFCLPMLATHLARPDGLGFGDVKFALLLGGGIGVLAPALVLPAFLLAVILHMAVCLASVARGRLVPFGPALALASAIIVAAGIWGLR
jgi:leader peptidase (prepilin peptidase) / N-methyltransferase